MYKKEKKINTRNLKIWNCISVKLILIKIKMKLILLLLITINAAFSLKCPPEEDIDPCRCDEVSKKITLRIGFYLR